MLSILVSTKAKVNRFCSVLTMSYFQRAGAAAPGPLCPSSTTQSSGSRQCSPSLVAKQGSLLHPLAQLTRVIFVRVYGRRLALLAQLGYRGVTEDELRDPVEGCEPLADSLSPFLVEALGLSP